MEKEEEGEEGEEEGDSYGIIVKRGMSVAILAAAALKCSAVRASAADQGGAFQRSDSRRRTPHIEPHTPCRYQPAPVAPADEAVPRRADDEASQARGGPGASGK